MILPLQSVPEAPAPLPPLSVSTEEWAGGAAAVWAALGAQQYLNSLVCWVSSGLNSETQVDDSPAGDPNAVKQHVLSEKTQ